MQTFSNPALAWDELPRHQSLELKQVMPAYKRILLIERVIIWLVMTLAAATALFFSTLAGKLWWILVGGLLLAALFGILMFTAIKAFQNMGYALRKHDFVFRKGWLFEKLHILPLKKIQHCQVKRGPLERRYGLASLKIFTAGGAGDAITLSGLTQQEAEQLKDWLVITPGELINQTPEEDADRIG
jgi:membrane protein YdbS with pleckstrin-like domain